MRFTFSVRGQFIGPFKPKFKPKLKRKLNDPYPFDVVAERAAFNRYKFAFTSIDRNGTYTGSATIIDNRRPIGYAGFINFANAR